MNEEKKQQSVSQIPQTQERQPGVESEMMPPPKAEDMNYTGTEKLKGQVALITGGDSGIGRAVAILFAKEGADIAITYLDEHDDAKETQQRIEEIGQKCFLKAGDISDEKFCQTVVKETAKALGKLTILVNNAAVQFPQEDLQKITKAQLEHTFRVNIFSYFYMTQAALKHLPEGGIIINTASVTAYKGNAQLIDYSATKGAIVAFTRSLSQSPSLLKKQIRVNAVAPGPIWTPLIPASFSAEKVAHFGEQVPMKRVGQPYEVAYSYLFLASAAASYMTGQILHPNGGVIVNS